MLSCHIGNLLLMVLYPGGKRVRFKSTTTEASSEQVFEAMGKIAVHIGNPAKFSKASKLALQLLQAGSVTSETAEPFFGILKAAMTTPSYATEAAVRLEYQALFTAVTESLEVCLECNYQVSYLTLNSSK